MLSEVFTAGDHRFSEVAVAFETCGFTPWATPTQQNDPLVFTSHEPQPVFSISSSDNSNPITQTDHQTKTIDEREERKRRRMISNRESARRSRKRKQKHLENLRNQLNRLKTGNRDLMNRLRLVSLHGKLLREENRRLWLESKMFEQKLQDICRALYIRQLNQPLMTSAWPCNNNFTYIYEQNPPSLIT
ncbi:hypothetical protein R6Q59_003535 [Mikania micrantha]|uniref:BZIP domain-containing protein n=1 Tax=Mikania micrantha TaxID=192012 RepID=A0A5N6ML24_9ASTR|nr:hypothetical protein E3N88_30086 [Mikania micrantha]